MPTDFATLRAAITQAKHAGVLQEFRDGYRRYRKAGDGVGQACWCALYDWDALDCEVRGGDIVLDFKRS